MYQRGECLSKVIDTIKAPFNPAHSEKEDVDAVHDKARAVVKTGNNVSRKFDKIHLMSRLRPYKIHFAALALYIVLAVVFTYPLAFSGDSIFGGGDAYQFLWNFWWFKQALSTSGNIFNTPYLFYPTGVSLALTTLTPFNSLLSIPLQMVFSLTYTYNLLCLLSFIIAGYGAFLLVRYLTGDNSSAVLAGIVFAFCPYHYAHLLGHLNLTAIEWIPFYALYFIRTIKEKTYKNPVLGALFLFLAAMCDFNYALYLLAFSALYVAYCAVKGRATVVNMDTAKKIGLLLALSAIMVSPIVYPMLTELFSGSTFTYGGDSEVFSADILGFFIPSQLNPIFHGIVMPVYANFSGGVAEYTVFAGYTVLLLSIFAVLKAKGRDTGFWALCAVVSGILALGPRLHVDGAITSVTLPFEIITRLPILDLSRVPSRWDIMVMLSLAVLAGYGYIELVKNIRGPLYGALSKKNAVALAISALILIEFLTIPLPMNSTKVPGFYYTLANDSDNYAIYEIPDVSYHATFPEYMYYQTVHEKMLITGYTHVPDSALKFTEDTAFINELYFVNMDKANLGTRGDILKQNLSKVGRSVLNYYNIRYVVVHKSAMAPDRLEYTTSLLGASLPEPPVEYGNDSMIVYHVGSAPVKSFMTLGGGWNELESHNGTFMRWMSNNGTVLIYSDKDRSANISFDALSIYQDRTLDIYLNNTLLSSVPVSTDLKTISTTVPLQKGDNILRFYVPEGPVMPSKLNPASPDTRELSLLFENISLSN